MRYLTLTLALVLAACDYNTAPYTPRECAGRDTVRLVLADSGKAKVTIPRACAK